MFFKIVVIIMVAIMALTVTSTFANERNKVVYGTDNRLDIYDSPNPIYQELARSTAALIRTDKMVPSEEIPGAFRLIGQTLKEKGKCDEVRFVHQKTVAICSGFLVAPDQLVTAGHCIRGPWDCRRNKWVFGFKMLNESDVVDPIPAENIYHCTEIIDRVYDVGGSVSPTYDDWALVKLDRPVEGRTPLLYRKEGKIDDSALLVVIGHPDGLPTKVADGGKIRSNYREKYFRTNLDTFGCNSGSAVFNAETGLVEGILVRGEQDYVWDDRRKCDKIKVCPENGDGCRGEDVTRITNIPHL